MQVEYRDNKDIPCDQLYRLFLAVGWAAEESTTPYMLERFNIGFLNSTYVFSAWVGEELAGCVRVLSDKVFRSVIYDLAVLPEYQGRGIGRELVMRCVAACEGSEWLVETDEAKGFYEKMGFTVNHDHFLTKKGKWF